MKQRSRKRRISARASRDAKPQPAARSLTAEDRAALRSISKSKLFTLDVSRGMYAGVRRLRPVIVHHPAAMSLNAQVAEKEILDAYARGVFSRSVTMQRLGLDWYGDLLQKMNRYGIARPSASPAEMLVMMKSADDVLGLLDARKSRHRSAAIDGAEAVAVTPPFGQITAASQPKGR